MPVNSTKAATLVCQPSGTIALASVCNTEKMPNDGNYEHRPQDTIHIETHKVKYILHPSKRLMHVALQLSRAEPAVSFMPNFQNCSLLTVQSPDISTSQ
jgi:hypothetical protein